MKLCKHCKCFSIKFGPYCNSCINTNIIYFGEYRMGLCQEEIETYIKLKSNKENVKGLIKKFNKIAGVNTCAIGPQGQILMYREDVKRFTDVLLGKTKSTYFD